MTEIAREMLEDVHVGDYVIIRYGTEKDQTIFEGTILKWSENLLSLKKEDGDISKIRLDDNLRSIDPINNKKQKLSEEIINKVNKEKSEDHLVSHDSSGESIKSTEQTTKVPNTQYRISRKMVTLSPAQPYVFVPKDEINTVKTMMKESSNTQFKKQINGIIDSINGALKTNEIEYKYHNLRARVLQTWDYCETSIEYKVFYISLGLIAIIAEDYEYSLEPLVRSGKYILASYAAAKGNLKESADIFSLCAILNEETDDINTFVSEVCVERKDVDVLKELLERFKNNQEKSEEIAACVYMLFSSCNGKLTSNISPFDSAYDTGKKLLECIPKESQATKSVLSYWNIFNTYTYPTNKVIEKQEQSELIGKIYAFNSDDKWGFITKDNYFYIEQVRDDTIEGILLRKMLYLGKWNNLEVKFGLGKSPIKLGQTAAFSVELTESGYNDAVKRSADVEKAQILHEGFIEDFYPQNLTGRIQSEGRKYKFNINSIVDPWLKSYYTNCFSPNEQDVSFEASGNNAINICWLNPTKEDYETYSDAVKPDDKEKWNAFLKKRTNRTETSKLPEEDPYAKYQYKKLVSTESETVSNKEDPLSWSGKTIIGNSTAETNIVGIITVHSEETTNKPVVQHKKLNSKHYAERARKAMIDGQLEDAERDFEASLRIGGFNESVVCDYISLCIRQEGKIDKATWLIDQYEKRISADKLLNIKIQVYDKKKDYTTLLPLYEEAFRKSTSVSKKSHNLIRLIDAYIKISRYSDALDACKRWDSFYNQNKYSSDADKLRNAVSNINRQKAICHYNLGRIEDARKIATELVRSNPADTTANSILDGTFGKEQVSFTIDDEIQDVSEIGEPEDAPGETGSLISRFVRLLLQQTDIAVNLKSRNIKDGRYIGTTREGLEDIKTLSKRSRLSSKMRSDTLLAACKLLEQIEQRDDYGEKNNEYYKYRLAGRAMASWGDFMVSQAGQLDTTRMAYLYALRVLIPTKNGSEQDWINSYNRYVKSYFMARVGSNSLDEYISLQTNSETKDGANTDILIGNRIQDVLLSEFVVGILMLIRAIYNQNERVKIFIEELYTKNEELRNSICCQLKCYFDRDISLNLSLETFKKSIMQASEILVAKQNSLHTIILEISNILLSKSLDNDKLANLDAENWKTFLTATDAARLNRIYYSNPTNQQDTKQDLNQPIQSEGATAEKAVSMASGKA